MERRERNNTPRTLAGPALAIMISLLGACHHAEPSSDSSAPKTASNASGSENFQGTITFRMESEVQKGLEMTYFLKGQRSRIETMIPNAPEGSTVMLWDLENGKISTLMPSRKTYISMDMKAAAEGIRNASKDLKRQAPEPEDKFPALVETGKQETIAGHTCEHWLMGDRQEIDMCVAKGLGYFGMGGQAGEGGFRAFKDLAFSTKLLAESANHPEWQKLLQGGAFPLKLEFKDGETVKMSMEATRIEQKILDDALFLVPADYREMKVPTLPGGGVPGGR